MSCDITDDEILSHIEDCSPAMDRHLATCVDCRSRAERYREAIEVVAAASAPPHPPLPERIGRYRIIRRLGEGGMGVVYEAEHVDTGKRAAIKVVRGGHSASTYFVKLIRREIRALQHLRHPSIATIYESGWTEDGQPFFAMELVPGGPITHYVRDRNMPLLQRLELFRELCDAITYAHENGVIHRDLKPTNILIDAEGKPRVLDFGLARITDPESGIASAATEFAQAMGTLPYMSPEQVRGLAAALNVRSDVYSLGVILYELLTGAMPYRIEKGDLAEAINVICHERPRPPSAVSPVVCGDLETICLVALEKEPHRRYASAAALAEDLRRYALDQPILARRASLLYRTRKLLVRNWILCTFAGSLLIVVLAARLWIFAAEKQAQEAIRLTTRLAEQWRMADKRDRADEKRDHAESLREALGRMPIPADQQASAAQKHQVALAIRKYREALAIYQDLGVRESDSVGRAMLGLGCLLVDQGGSTAYEANGLLVDAIAMFCPTDRPGVIGTEEACPGWAEEAAAASAALDELDALLLRLDADEDHENLMAAPEA